MLARLHLTVRCCPCRIANYAIEAEVALTNMWNLGLQGKRRKTQGLATIQVLA
jgi:hypothetical protein